MFQWIMILLGVLMVFTLNPVGSIATVIVAGAGPFLVRWAWSKSSTAGIVALIAYIIGVALTAYQVVTFHDPAAAVIGSLYGLFLLGWTWANIGPPWGGRG